MGLPFSRNEEGLIAQRPFGGHTNNSTKKPVRRACYAADRTGHMILQTLYQHCIKQGIKFFNEFLVIDLILQDGVMAGVVALEISTISETGVIVSLSELISKQEIKKSENIKPKRKDPIRIFIYHPLLD
jgi:succinate dehydrogenase/fumarate reductase flavoprotein subunit